MAETLTKAGKQSSCDIEKRSLKGGGGSAAGGSDKFRIVTGVPDLRFFLSIDRKSRQFLPESSRYSTIAKENHNKENIFLQL